MKLRFASQKYSLRNRFLLLFLFLGLITAFVYLTAVYSRINKIVNQNMYHFYSLQTKSFAILFSSKIDKAQIRVNNTARFLAQYQNLDEKVRRKTVRDYLAKTLQESKEDFGIFTIWKRYSFDSRDKEFQDFTNGISGQFGVWYIKELKMLKETPITINEIDLLTRYSQQFSNVMVKSLVLAPIRYHSPIMLDTTIVARIVVPLRDKNKGNIAGILGTDIEIDQLVDQFPVEVLSRMIIVNEELKIVYHAKTQLIGKKLTQIYPKLQVESEIIHSLNTGTPITTAGYFFSNERKDLLISHPININGKHWNLILRVPHKEVAARTNRIWIASAILLFLALLVVISIFVFFERTIFKHVSRIEDYIDEITQGHFDVEISGNTENVKELSKIYNAIERLKTKLLTYTKFTEQMSLGNFEEIDLELDYEDDLLGRSLKKLQENLIENKRANEEIQKKQEIENWHNSGIARFNEIIRQNINDIENLSYEIIKELAHYVDAIVGGFFYMKQTIEGEEYLDLTGFYAYSRKVYHKKRVELGDGLIGNVALEKKRLYINVPDNYLEIISGMGKAKPNYLVIQPMISGELVYGIIELAKINEFSEHELKFIEEVSNIVASSLASSRITEETKRLLEESQKVAQEMKEKEEKLRKSLAELEEFKNKSEEQRKHLETIVGAINEIVYYIEFSPTLKVISINDMFLNKLKYSYAEATSTNYFELLNVPLDQIDVHRQYWERLKKSEIIKFDYGIKVHDEEIWIKAVLVPVTKNYKLERVIFLGIDYTEVKLKEKEVNEMLLDLNEKQEKITVQEMELELTTQELNKLYKELDSKEQKIEILEKELEKLKSSYGVLQKEFEKRLKRSRKIESSLKEKIKALEDELKKCKGDQ